MTAPVAGTSRTAAVDQAPEPGTAVSPRRDPDATTPTYKAVFVPKMTIAVRQRGTTSVWVKSKNSAVEIVAEVDRVPEPETAAKTTAHQVATMPASRTAYAAKMPIAAKPSGTGSAWVRSTNSAAANVTAAVKGRPARDTAVPALAARPTTLVLGRETASAIVTARAAGMKPTAGADPDPEMAIVVLPTGLPAVMMPTYKAVSVLKTPTVVKPSGTIFAWAKSRTWAVEAAVVDLALEATAVLRRKLPVARMARLKLVSAHRTRFAVILNGTSSVSMRSRNLAAATAAVDPVRAAAIVVKNRMGRAAKTRSSRTVSAPRTRFVVKTPGIRSVSMKWTS